jgi:hypothetical protein
MQPRQFVRAIARSPLGIGAGVFALATGVGARFAGLGLVLSVLAGLGCLGLSLFTLLALGLLSRAAVAELVRTFDENSARRLAEAGVARKRLAVMRIADPVVAQARDLLVLEAGRLIEDCGKARTYDPEAVQAICDGPGLVDAWLREADERSVERRFALPDANPFPEAARRTAEVLVAKATLIAARRAAAIGEIPAADQLAIEEELK